VLAALGTFLLVSYVRGAEQRALEGEELVTVLVVEAPIAEGTDAESLHGAVRQEDVPVKVRATGSVSNLADLSGRVATVDLMPGEQIIESRFVTEEAYAARTRIDVPVDFLQVTVSLNPARAVGGQLLAGDHVAVIGSFEPFPYNAIQPEEVEEAFGDLGLAIVITETGIFHFRLGEPEPGEDDPTDDLPFWAEETEEPVGGSLSPSSIQTPSSTRIIAHKVLITNVQIEKQPVADPDMTGPDLAPTGNLLITLAGDAEAVERIVFTAEYGMLWLAIEDPEATEVETDIRTRGNIY
jgi:pilus assembly protein CpaB